MTPTRSKHHHDSITIPRTILTDPLFSDNESLLMWLQLLMDAAHTSGSAYGDFLYKGQLYTTYFKLMIDTRIDFDDVRRIVNEFKMRGLITLKHHKGRLLISIPEYDYWANHKVYMEQTYKAQCKTDTDEH